MYFFPHVDDDELSSDEDLGEEQDEAELLNDKQHKKSLAKLKETDPEFYQFLEENDKKLLQFNVSDSESESENDEDTEKIHKPPVKLEVSSNSFSKCLTSLVWTKIPDSVTVGHLNLKN